MKIRTNQAGDCQLIVDTLTYYADEQSIRCYVLCYAQLPVFFRATANKNSPYVERDSFTLMYTRLTSSITAGYLFGKNAFLGKNVSHKLYKRTLETKKKILI